MPQQHWWFWWQFSWWVSCRWGEFDYSWSTSNLNYQLQAKHRPNATFEQKQHKLQMQSEAPSWYGSQILLDEPVIGMVCGSTMSVGCKWSKAAVILKIMKVRVRVVSNTAEFQADEWGLILSLGIKRTLGEDPLPHVFYHSICGIRIR